MREESLSYLSEVILYNQHICLNLQVATEFSPFFLTNEHEEYLNYENESYLRIATEQCRRAEASKLYESAGLPHLTYGIA